MSRHLGSELKIVHDHILVRGVSVRAWCSSVVFERGVRARSARVSNVLLLTSTRTLLREVLEHQTPTLKHRY